MIVYAEGEALLGWLNAIVGFSHPKEVDAAELLRSCLNGIQAGLQNTEIAHLKIALRSDESSEVGVINLVRSNSSPEFSGKPCAWVKSGELTINLRAEEAPAELHTAVQHAIRDLAKQFPGLETEVGHLQYFRPGKPEPTHRMLTPAG